MSSSVITHPVFFFSFFETDVHIWICSSQFISSAVTAVTTTGTRTHLIKGHGHHTSHVISQSYTQLLSLDPSHMRLTEILPQSLTFYDDNDKATSKQFCSNLLIIDSYTNMCRGQLCIYSKVAVIPHFWALEIFFKSLCLCLFRKQKRIWPNQRSTRRLETFWTQWSLKDDFWSVSVLTVRFTCFKCPFLSSGSVCNRGGKLNPFRVSVLDVIIFTVHH